MDQDAFAREAEHHFGTVREAMTARVLALEPTLRASEAAMRLAEEGVAGAPVLEGERIVGVLTLRDLLEREGGPTTQTHGPFLRGERRLANLTVADVMTRDVVVASADWPLTRAIEAMESSGVNRLPVVDEQGRAVGILARDDVIRAVARGLREPGEHHVDAPQLEPN